MVQRKKLAKPGELLSSEKFMGPSNKVDQQPCSCSSKSSGSKHSEVNNEDVWRCNYCQARWLGEDDDDNRQIVCSKKYYLHCSGTDCAEEQHYDIDIENNMFFCKECEFSRQMYKYIYCEVIKILANFDLKYMKRKLSHNFIASLISLVKRFFLKKEKDLKKQLATLIIKT